MPNLEVLQSLRQIARPLPRSIHDEDALDALAREMASARVVMLGEATHGTEEFYELRALLSKKLIENHGFKFIAVEGDWPDCERLNRYIHDDENQPATAAAVMRGFKRWPTWMWGNWQTAKFLEWAKGRDVGFHGLDVYSLSDSLTELRRYARELDEVSATKIEAIADCFEPFHRNEIQYAAALARLEEGCEEQALASLTRLLQVRLEQTRLSPEEFFDARQNARTVRNAEKYYRAILAGGASSWNVRDEHMMEVLDVLLERYGEDARGIVWAHNTHIGDYRGTEMRQQGYVNIGGLARLRYGTDNVFLCGFSTHRGQVLAGHAWGAPQEILPLLPARPESWEGHFQQIATELKSPSLVFSFGPEAERKLKHPALARRRGHRAIGVVYQTDYEHHGHNYVPTDLLARYDSLIFIERTSALITVPPAREEHGLIPETWPQGV